MFCCKSHVARYSVEFNQVWGVPNPGVDDLLPLLGCFEVKSHVARYSVEVDRVWGVPNPGVNDFPSVLRYFAVSRT